MSNLFKRFAHHTASYHLDIECAMDGPEDATIAFVGEYPGEQEVAFNKPFIGGAGKQLWNAVRKHNLHRANVYTTNAVKRRVNRHTPLNVNEFSLWQEALQWELDQLPNLEYIVCLGSTALQMLTGHKNITQHRGSVYDYKHCKLLVANNPAMILRMPQTEIIFLMDMMKLKRLITGDFRTPHITRVINPTFEEAMQYMDDIQRLHKRFAMDIEVIANETACLGLANSATHAMCINFRDKRDNVFTLEEEYKLLRKFLEVADDPTTTVIAQNGNFDSYWMGFKDHATFRVDFDTLLAHHTLYPRLPHNLGFLTAQYTDHPYHKDEKDKFREGGDIDEFWRYNCTDCAVTFAVAEEEEKELRTQGLYDFFMNHVMRLQPHLSYCTTVGEPVDLDRKDKLNAQLRAELEEYNQALQEAIRAATNDENYSVNPNSPKQVTALLFDKLNCKAPRRSADYDTREAILKDPRTGIETKNVITILNRYAEQHKFYSTYVNTNIDEDGRFRAEYKQYGVQSAPGRLSSSQTLWGSGGNAQNMPRRALEMFVADPGCVVIYFDLAQAEARYVGWDADIPHWIEDFERARIDGAYDAHRSLAATMFGVPYDEVPKKDEDENGNFTMRYIAKRCRHGLNYRMHIARLAQTTGLTYPQAASNYHLYHRTNPQLQHWWRVIEQQVRRNKMLFNSYGRRLFIAERLDSDDALQSIVAFRPQSTIGDKTQRVWYQSHEDDEWDSQRARIFRNVHDSLWGFATPCFAEKALAVMKKHAEEPVVVTSIVTNEARQLIIPADLKMSVPDEEGVHRLSTLKDFYL